MKKPLLIFAVALVLATSGLQAGVEDVTRTWVLSQLASYVPGSLDDNGTYQHLVTSNLKSATKVPTTNAMSAALINYLISVLPGSFSSVTTTGNVTVGGNETVQRHFLPATSTIRTVQSATTTDLGNATEETLILAGTTNITGFQTAPPGTVKRLRYTGSGLNVAYNASSMITPGARSIDIEVNDRIEAISLGAGNWFWFLAAKGNGSVLGDVVVVTETAGAQNVSAVSMHGQTHLVTDTGVKTLPAAVIGMSAEFLATTAAVMTLDSNAADQFVLNGTALTAGYKLVTDGSVSYQWVYIKCTAANKWNVYSNAVVADGGA